MNFSLDDKGRLTATIRGKIVEIDKFPNNLENYKGKAHYYNGTCLLVHVEAYGTAEYVLNGVRYITPKKFAIECYENVRSLIGNPESIEARIGPKQKAELVKRYKGLEVDIFMGLVNEHNEDDCKLNELGLIGELFTGPVKKHSEADCELSASVVVGRIFVKDRPLFIGKITLDRVE